MFWFNMGPRGRMFGHRGFRPGIFLGVLGLLFFGWIIVAVFGGLIGAGIMIFGSVLSGLARLAGRILPALFSAKGFFAGLVIGLVWALNNRKRNQASAKEEETEEEKKEEAEEPVIETQHYRFNG